MLWKRVRHSSITKETERFIVFIKVNNGKNSPLFLLLMKFYLILRRLFPKKKSELNKNKELKMIIVPVKEGENIERALKKFKRKYEKTGVVKELRRRQQFDKPSELKRLKMEHAIYVQKLQQNEE